MAKVLGVGGVFLASPDPSKLRDWYRTALGIEFAEWGGVTFEPGDLAAAPGANTTLAAFAAPAAHFAPSPRDHMLNLVVDDLDGILARCAAAGIEPLAPPIDDVFGRFAHVLDPDGRKIELWQPKAGS